MATDEEINDHKKWEKRHNIDNIVLMLFTIKERYIYPFLGAERYNAMSDRDTFLKLIEQYKDDDDYEEGVEELGELNCSIDIVRQLETDTKEFDDSIHKLRLIVQSILIED